MKKTLVKMTALTAGASSLAFADAADELKSLKSSDGIKC